MTSQKIYNKALLLFTVTILLTGFLATAGTFAPADAAAPVKKTFNVTVTAVDKATNDPIIATAKIVQGSFVKTGPTPLTASLKQASVSITIQDPTNYKFSSWSTGSTVQPLVFPVKSDTTVRALFTQIVAPPSPAYLTVIKKIVNDDGGTAALADFTLMVDSQVVQNGTAVTVPPGVAHTVTESTSAGQTDKYSASFSDSCPGGVITVQSSQSLVCVLTNNDIPPPPPPPPAEAVGSFYIPLYRIANHPAVAEAKQAHPNVEFMVSINPSNGPGNSEDLRFDPAIQTMRNAGVEKIIGYVPTWYGRATENPPQGSPYTGIVYDIPTVKAYIDRYVAWYDVDGISFDEVSTSTDPTILDFYQQITDYAKSKGLAMLKANPGTPTPEVYIQMFDNTGIFESGSYPSESAIQSATFFNSYPREKFTIVVHSSSVLNEAWLSMALNYVKYIYITNDGGSNPYDTLPTYMESELSILESG